MPKLKDIGVFRVALIRLWRGIKLNDPSHDNTIDTHADDYNSQHGKTCSQRIVGELHLTALIKL